MEQRDVEARLREVKARAEGTWRTILESIGVEATVLNKRNQPCPGCGGTDRFQYTDKYHHGDYYCRGCGPGDGFRLAEMALGLSFMEVFRQAEAGRRETGGSRPDAFTGTVGGEDAQTGPADLLMR